MYTFIKLIATNHTCWYESVMLKSVLCFFITKTDSQIDADCIRTDVISPGPPSLRRYLTTVAVYVGQQKC